MNDYRRWVYVFIAVAAAAGLMGIAGCASNGPSPAKNQAGNQSRSKQADQSNANRAKPTPVSIKDRQSGLNAEGLKFFTLKHITTEAGFEALSLDHMEPANFDDSDMILLGLGEQPTGGYWVRITNLQMRGNTLEVHATANQPGDNASVSQSLTHPYTIVTTPKIKANRVTSDIQSVTGQNPGEDEGRGEGEGDEGR